MAKDTVVLNRNLYLCTAINNDSTSEVIKSIKNINIFDQEQDSKLKNYKIKPIVLHIQSFGGNVYDMWALIDTIETSFTPVATICCGYCMSAAAMIFMSGHTRYMTKHSTLMLHQMACGTLEKYNDFIITEQEFSNLHKESIKFIKKHSKLPKSYIEKYDNKKEDIYLTTKDCLKYGVCDYKIKKTKMTLVENPNEQDE